MTLFSNPFDSQSGTLQLQFPVAVCDLIFIGGGGTLVTRRTLTSCAVLKTLICAESEASVLQCVVSRMILGTAPCD